MEPVKFVGMNTNYVADSCDDLPALVEKQGSGEVCITSVWKPSEEDLKRLNEGGCVCLAVYGGQPPVSLWVQEVNIVE